MTAARLNSGGKRQCAEAHFVDRTMGIWKFVLWPEAFDSAEATGPGAEK